MRNRKNGEVPPLPQLLLDKLEEQNKKFISIIEALNIRTKKKQKLSYQLLLNKLNFLESQNYLRQYESFQINYLNQLKTDINRRCFQNLPRGPNPTKFYILTNGTGFKKPIASRVLGCMAHKGDGRRVSIYL